MVRFRGGGRGGNSRYGGGRGGRGGFRSNNGGGYSGTNNAPLGRNARW